MTGLPVVEHQVDELIDDVLGLFPVREIRLDGAQCFIQVGFDIGATTP